MLSWTVWVPAIALSVIAFIGYRRLAAAGSFFSQRGARLAALQVGVAFVLLAGTSAAAETCTEGARRCTSCDYFPVPPPGQGFGVIFGEECEGGQWQNVESFYGDGDEGEACGEAGVECGIWTTL